MDLWANGHDEPIYYDDIRVFAQVEGDLNYDGNVDLADLQGFHLPDRKIDDDAVGMEARGLDASFKPACRHSDLKRSFGR